MANISRRENGICAIELTSPLSFIEDLDVYFRSGEIWYPIVHKFISNTTLVFAEGTGASFIVPAATNSESLTVVVLNKSKVIQAEEILYFPTSFFKSYLDLAGVNFNPTWNKIEYKKTQDIAVFTRVFNESEFIEIFVRHYRELTKPANIYLIDHSSDNTDFHKIAQQYGCQVITIPRGETDENNMRSFCEYFQRFLLSKYQWVIYADIDELLVHRSGTNYLRGLLLNDDWMGLYKPEYAYEIYHDPDNEPEFDFAKKITRQRKVLVPHNGYLKPLISSERAVWSPGFHKALNGNQQILQDLWLVHISYVSLGYRVRRELERGSERRSQADLSANLTVARFTNESEQLEKIKKEFTDRIYHDKTHGDTITVPEWMIDRY
jgi:hypothetical protein